MTTKIPDDVYESRFITKDDLRNDHVVFDLHPSWWSRPYEYAWAERIVEKSDVVLDAACGLAHPFKFHLVDLCREVHACDIDERILSEQALLDDIKKDFGEEVSKNVPPKYLRNIYYHKADLSSLPYVDKMFDKIFCISVLEHLKDYFNRYPYMQKMPFLSFVLHQDIYRALKEFNRTLKDDGLIALTFDYPDINFDYLKKIIPMLNLRFAGPASFDIPDDAVYSKELDIFCFRALLAKNNLDH